MLESGENTDGRNTLACILAIDVTSVSAYF